MKRRRRWNARRPMPGREFFTSDDLCADEIVREPQPIKADRKVHQLCRQVERALGLAFAGCGDPLLQELAVEHVTPAPDASRLLVSIRAPGLIELEHRSDLGGAEKPRVLGEILDRLERVRGLLRREMTEAITRKRAPELVFQVLPPEGGEVRP